MMTHGIYKLLGAAALSFFGFAAQAQDIKLGFNGDLSASPSALSGQAAVLGLQAAIDDVNGAGGVLGRKLTLVVRKAFGGAAITMNSRDLGADLVFAWPGAEVGIMAASEAVAITDRRRLQDADPRERELAALRGRARIIDLRDGES